MRVAEVFSSIQGEGINMGRMATFVRLVGCNLKCSWCDTKYALSGGTELSVDELADEVYKYDNNLIVFTGGEPMLQINAIEEWMIAKAPESWCRLALETNGTIEPGVADEWFDHVAVSPKLTSSKTPPYDVDILREWRDCFESVEFKFVIGDKLDLEEARDLAHDLQLFQRQVPVILQPNGLKEPYSQALKELVSMVRDYKFKHYVQILPQLHRVIWGKDAKGV